MSAPLKIKFLPEHQGHWVAHVTGKIIDVDRNIYQLLKRNPDARRQRSPGNVVNLTFVPVGFIG